MLLISHGFVPSLQALSSSWCSVLTAVTLNTYSVVRKRAFILTEINQNRLQYSEINMIFLRIFHSYVKVRNHSEKNGQIRRLE